VIDQKDHRAVDRSGQDGNDVLDIEWFGEYGEGSLENRLVDEALDGKRRQRITGISGMQASDGPKRAPRHSSRHSDIREDEIEGFSAYELECAQCVFGADGVEALELEIGDQRQEERFFVVYDEDAHVRSQDSAS